MSTYKIRHKIIIFALLLCLIMPLFCGLTTAKAEERFCADPTFNGAGTSVDADETINYDSYTILEDVSIPAPSYFSTNSSLTNSCAPVTGTNVCGFYDRWFPNLVPNYTTCYVSGSYVVYPAISGEPIQTCISTLYSLMGTNVGGAGTTQSGFQNGLVQYFTNQGYSLSYQSIKTSSTNINLNALKQAVQNDNVAVLSFTKFNFVTTLVYDENSVDVYKDYYNAGHMLMVNGYKTVAYYKDGVNFRTDTYLYSSSGFGSGITGYVLLGDNMTIVEAITFDVA